MIGFCFLAYGDEHIDECNILIQKLLKYNSPIKIFVGTDKPEKIIKHNSIKTTLIVEDFNYNLKRVAIEQALKECNTIISLDTDFYVLSNGDFSYFENIEDGVYVSWIGKEVDFMGVNVKLDYPNLSFIDESILLIKISDKLTKNLFIKNWETIFKETEFVQPNNGKPGAIEGLIIYLSSIKSNLNVKSMWDYKNLILFLDGFYHYTRDLNKNKLIKANVKKELI